MPLKTRKLIIRCLVEGQSVRATARTADVSKNTVTKLLIAAGKACADYQDKALWDLPCQRIQVDEIWAFIYAKEKNVTRAKAAPPEAGDVWTWTAICADTKLWSRHGGSEIALARPLSTSWTICGHAWLIGPTTKLRPTPGPSIGPILGGSGPTTPWSFGPMRTRKAKAHPGPRIADLRSALHARGEGGDVHAPDHPHRWRQAHRPADRARHPASASAPSEVLAVDPDACADLDGDA